MDYLIAAVQFVESLLLMFAAVMSYGGTRISGALLPLSVVYGVASTAWVILLQWFDAITPLSAAALPVLMLVVVAAALPLRRGRRKAPQTPFSAVPTYSNYVPAHKPPLRTIRPRRRWWSVQLIKAKRRIRK